MPYIPHTEACTDEMLKTIGVSSIEDLFDEIPKALRSGALKNIPPGINEQNLNRLVNETAKNVDNPLCFLGAGAYEHHIPAAVWDIVSRGEFLTAYTPYQAEASQGTLQLLYEYQTMMASLTGMETSNASLYDGASALAEAVLMAIRANKKSKSKRVLVLGALHPHYFDTVKAIVSNQEIELVSIPFQEKKGLTELNDIKQYAKEDVAALVVQHPNFFGVLEEVDGLTDWAHQQGALVIAVTNPISLALLKPPGQWGETGADIVCGEGQPLGVPLASGGPYFGFLTTKMALIRQMPGRLIGRTVDKDGREGFTLTLQAREQHIRRSKATSNICTNQGLLVTAATIHMSLLGFDGLREVASTSHSQTNALVQLVKKIPGVNLKFNSPYFHEVVFELPSDVDTVIGKMYQRGIAPGLSLKPYYKVLGNCMVTCVTETKTDDELKQYAKELTSVLNEVK